MNVNSKSRCIICLSSDAEQKLIKSSLCNKFLRQIIHVETTSNETFLCIWCNVAVKKTMELVKMAKKSQSVLTNSENTKKSIKSHNLTFHCKNYYDASFSHSYCNYSTTGDKYQLEKKSIYENINFISISEIRDKYLDPDTCENTIAEEKITQFKKAQQEIVPNGEDQINLQEKEQILNIDREKQNHAATKSLQRKKCEMYKRKEINHKELNFKVKYLTKEEQLNNLMIKKQSEKYRNMKYRCDNCGVGFMTQDVYVEHLKRHDESAGPHICQICSLRFKSKEVFSHHKLSHRRVFTCVECGSTFTRWPHCVVHRQKCGVAHVSSPQVCVVCGKLFGNAQSLRIHVKGVHECTNTHTCKKCGKCFRNKQRLTVHVRTHSGVKEFDCPICSLRFSTHSNLRAHSTVHENVKAHYCVECNTFYKTLKGLKRHFKESTRHAVKEVLAYPCLKCMKSFATEKSLNNHVIERHLTANICDTCKKSFSSKANLRKHERSIHGAK